MAGSIRVSIDGRSVDPVTFDFLYQEDPFPGGHAYELVVADSTAVPRLPTSDQPLTRSAAVQVFSAVDRLKAREGLTPFSLEWFFNSVDSIASTDAGWIIRGACSPVRTPSSEE